MAFSALTEWREPPVYKPAFCGETPDGSRCSAKANIPNVFILNQSTTFLLIAISIGFLAGGLLGAQPSVNGSLGKSVAHPLQASLISFASGTAILLLLVVTVGGGFPPKFIDSPSGLPWWTWVGGAMGVVYVSTSLLLVPKIGSLPWFAAAMTGQVITALALDHYGLLGNPKTPVSVLRLIGTLLLVLGVLAIVGGKHLEQRKASPAEASAVDSSPGHGDGNIDRYAKRKSN